METVHTFRICTALLCRILILPYYSLLVMQMQAPEGGQKTAGRQLEERRLSAVAPACTARCAAARVHAVVLHDWPRNWGGLPGEEHQPNRAIHTPQPRILLTLASWYWSDF